MKASIKRPPIYPLIILTILVVFSSSSVWAMGQMTFDQIGSTYTPETNYDMAIEFSHGSTQNWGEVVVAGRVSGTQSWGQFADSVVYPLSPASISMQILSSTGEPLVNTTVALDRGFFEYSLHLEEAARLSVHVQFHETTERDPDAIRNYRAASSEGLIVVTEPGCVPTVDHNVDGIDQDCDGVDPGGDDDDSVASDSDGDADGTDDQIEGHESWFAEAEVISAPIGVNDSYQIAKGGELDLINGPFAHYQFDKENDLSGVEDNQRVKDISGSGYNLGASYLSSRFVSDRFDKENQALIKRV